MGLHDVAFLPFRASIYTKFLNNCGRGEGLGTITRLECVLGGNQENAPFKKIFLRQILFFALVQFHEDHKTLTYLR